MLLRSGVHEVSNSAISKKKREKCVALNSSLLQATQTLRFTMQASVNCHLADLAHRDSGRTAASGHGCALQSPANTPVSVNQGTHLLHFSQT